MLTYTEHELNERIIKLAKRLANSVETLEKHSGETVYLLKDSAPKWMSEVVLACFIGESGNSEIVLELVKEMAGELADAYPDNNLDEVIGNKVGDFETHKLLRWLATGSGHISYVDDAVNNGDYHISENAEFSLFDLLQHAQGAHMQEIGFNLLSELTNRAEKKWGIL